MPTDDIENMSSIKNPKLRAYSRDLRNSMTPEERRLWYDFLKSLPHTVHRQKIIGPYIVDFYIASARIVIEVDGIQHQTQEKRISDAKRDRYLNDLEITVLRYTNRNVNECFNAVCEDILKHIENAD